MLLDSQLDLIKIVDVILFSTSESVLFFFTQTLHVGIHRIIRILGQTKSVLFKKSYYWRTKNFLNLSVKTVIFALFSYSNRTVSRNLDCLVPFKNHTKSRIILLDVRLFTIYLYLNLFMY